MAPLWKWCLAITPLVGLFQGYPKVENIDVLQTWGLTLTGVIWTYYGLLVRPPAYLLCACNAALAVCNGAHLVRKYRYEKEKEKREKLAIQKK